MRRVFIALQAALLAGCSLDPSGLTSPADAGPPVDGTDAAVDPGLEPGEDGGFDGGFDGGPPIPGVDSGFDAGSDASFDASFDGGTDAGPLPPCDSLYGGAPGYSPCDQRDTECEFYTNAPGGSQGSCDSVCGPGNCIEVHDNGFSACMRFGALSCSGTYRDQICICRRSR